MARFVLTKKSKTYGWKSSTQAYTGKQMGWSTCKADAEASNYNKTLWLDIIISVSSGLPYLDYNHMEVEVWNQDFGCYPRGRIFESDRALTRIFYQQQLLSRSACYWNIRTRTLDLTKILVYSLNFTIVVHKPKGKAIRYAEYGDNKDLALLSRTLIFDYGSILFFSRKKRGRSISKAYSRRNQATIIILHFPLFFLLSSSVNFTSTFAYLWLSYKHIDFCSSMSFLYAWRQTYISLHLRLHSIDVSSLDWESNSIMMPRFSRRAALLLLPVLVQALVLPNDISAATSYSNSLRPEYEEPSYGGPPTFFEYRMETSKWPSLQTWLTSTDLEDHSIKFAIPCPDCSDEEKELLKHEVQRKIWPKSADLTCFFRSFQWDRPYRTRNIVHLQIRLVSK